jgi:flagellar biosynthesis protein FlhG
MIKQPIIIGIGGGKGGVGKSMISSNLAVIYAKMGFKVALFDLDFGAANIHTLFGLRKPERALSDFFMTPKSKLNDYLLPTSIENLYFAPGSGYVPELANLKYLQKLKLIKQLRQVSADLILLDLGAGSSYNVVDFFAMTDMGLIVTTPEPTATTNAYEFLKNVIFRALFRTFRKHPEMDKVLKAMTHPSENLNLQTVNDLLNYLDQHDPFAKETVAHLIKSFKLFIIVNQAHKITEVKLGEKLQEIAQKYLSLDLNYAGIIFYNPDVNASVIKMSPVSLLKPHSTTTKCIERMAHIIMQHHASSRLSDIQAEEFSTQVKRVYSYAFSDYESTLLEKKKNARS